jgi:hypothetical protein
MGIEGVKRVPTSFLPFACVAAVPKNRHPFSDTGETHLDGFVSWFLGFDGMA